MSFLGYITVRFKKSVLEPQGQATLLSLKESGHNDIQSIRVGKHIEISLEAQDEKDAKSRLEKIANQLLYNPVMEYCEITVQAI